MLEAAVAVPGTIEVLGTGPLALSVERAALNGLLTAAGKLGPQEVRERIAASLALVVPSMWYEGFPMVVLEAFASGTPVIASRIGSLADIVDDGVTGILVEPGDATALAAALSWALTHEGDLRRMGIAARQQFDERYAAPRHLAALMALYGSVRPAAGRGA